MKGNVTSIARSAFLTSFIFNTSCSVSYEKPKQIPNCNVPTITNISLQTPTSTRLTNQDRYSLEKLHINKQKLKYISQLNPGWNGYEAEPFDEGLIQYVVSIIEKLDYQPKIFPTGRGSVQIEYYKDELNLIEVEVFKDELVLFQIKNGVEVESTISEVQLNEIVAEFYVG